MTGLPIAPSCSWAESWSPSPTAPAPCASATGERCMVSESVVASGDRAIRSTPAARSSFLATAWLITRKDLVIEFRSREVVYTTLFFAVSCVLVFAFSFVRKGSRHRTRRRDPLDRDRILRDPGAGARVRARASERHAAGADAHAGDRPGCVHREARRRAGAAGGGRGDRDAAGGPDVSRAALRPSRS